MQNFSNLQQLKTLDEVSTNPAGTSIATFNANMTAATYIFKRLNRVDVILLLFSFLALFLWSTSLQTIKLNDMNDLGLISALSPRIIVASGILVVSFALTIQRREIQVLLLVFQILCLILILYGTPHLVEEVPRFTPVYRHAGYTDYIMQTGSVDPSLDIYFNWPGFFVLSALCTKIFGYSTILSYAGWTPVFYNLLYIGPMYVIFTSISANKRLVWLSLLFFQLTNWVGQDYFSPQGLNFFLYLIIIMILVKWFRMPSKARAQSRKSASFKQKFFAWLKAPDPLSPPLKSWQRRGLLCCLILVYGLIVCSHPLTPFFVLLSVFTLVLFRRCYPFWLPILMTIILIAWIFIVARPYLSQHGSGIINTLGDLTANLPKSIATGQMKERTLYAYIAEIRLYVTLLLWLLAFLGAIKRLRQGQRDITVILLAINGFAVIAAQSYGGEILMRIYLFTEPFMCFFAAALFFDNRITRAFTPARTHPTFLWRTAAIIAATIILLGSFFFTRYGDEHVDYISHKEWDAVQYLYRVAPNNSLIVEAWNDAPLYFEHFSKYTIANLTTTFPEAVMHTDVNGVVQFFENEHNPDSYIIFSQEEQIHASAWDELPPDMLKRLETGLLQTGKFKLLYSNSDTEILQFVGDSRQ